LTVGLRWLNVSGEPFDVINGSPARSAINHRAIGPGALDVDNDMEEHVIPRDVARNRTLRQLPANELEKLVPLVRVELAVRTVLHGARLPVYFSLSDIVSLLSIMRTGEAIETGVVGNDGVVGAGVAIQRCQQFRGSQRSDRCN
jgi:hypothetical protein